MAIKNADNAERMPFEIVCDECGFILYRGSEMRSSKDVLRTFKGRCASCNEKLSLENFGMEVSPANRHRPTVLGVGQSYFVA